MLRRNAAHTHLSDYLAGPKCVTGERFRPWDFSEHERQILLTPSGGIMGNQRGQTAPDPRLAFPCAQLGSFR